MVLLDKLNQRPMNRAQSPLPSYTDQIRQPSAAPTIPMAQRMQALPQRGAMGSMPQNQNINKRFIADLPAKVQLQGIQTILNGGTSGNQIIDNFVSGMAAQGKQPEEIRQAFLAHQKQSNNPLVLMGG